MRVSAKSIVICPLFTALIAVGAFIKIPGPVVPYTLQTLFVMLCACILSPGQALLSTTLYMVLGLCGIPVFAAGGGFTYVFNPSFGYIIGFCIASYPSGMLLKKKGSYTLSCICCLCIIYLSGILYYCLLSALVLDITVSAGYLLLYCFALTIPFDILLCIPAVLISRRVAAQKRL